MSDYNLIFYYVAMLEYVEWLHNKKIIFTFFILWLWQDTCSKHTKS